MNQFLTNFKMPDLGAGLAQEFAKAEKFLQIPDSQELFSFNLTKIFYPDELIKPDENKEI